MNARPIATQNRSPLRKILRIAAIVLLIALVLAGLAALWAWHNRYAILERQAITYLDSIGIEAELSIRNATGTQADIRGIELAQNGERFLSVDRLEAEYQWRDLLGGQVERLAFTGLEATVTLDESGNIIDGWVPPTSGTGGAGLPPRGISVTRAAVTLRTPYGTLPISGDANIRSLDAFDFTGRIDAAQLARDGLRIDADGPLAVQRKGGPVDVSTSGLALGIAHPSGQLDDTTFGATATVDPETLAVSGAGTLSGGTFLADVGIAGGIDTVSIDGTWAENILQADMDVRIAAFRVTDPERRETLARTLSLADALSEVPVAQNFAPGLVAPLDDLLSGTDLTAELSVRATPEARRLSLRNPMTLRTPRTQATLSPVEDSPLYRYAVGSGGYEIATRATLSRLLQQTLAPLTLAPLTLTIRSDDGLSVDGVARASGQVITRADWRTRTAENRLARLGPLYVGFDYNAPQTEPATLSLRGAADYDGDVPGGYIEGLKASGVLSATLTDDGNRVNFEPDRRLNFARLETTSDWTLADFDGTIRPAKPLYRSTSSGASTVRTALSDTTLTAMRPQSPDADAASLRLSIGRAALSGTITDAAQDWDVTFEALGLTSDTFPVIGTDLVLPEGDLSVALSADARTRFDLSAPTSTLNMPAYAVAGMAIDVSGTADAYTLNHQGGQVRVVQADDAAAVLPAMPASGTLTFADGEFTGQAQSSLPGAADTPFDIDYRLVDGRGTAQVVLRNLRFQPGKLQPQNLVPALRGKIARVEGAVDADLDIVFGGDTPPSGTGVVRIRDMSLGTAPGPVTGLSGTVELMSLFPVITAPEQRLNIIAFDPGFPLENGVVDYALVTDGVAISQAIFPLGEGQVSFDPFTWTYGAEENRVTLRVSGVEIGEFLKDIGEGRLSATGTLEGAIPVVVRGIDVRVENGRLEVKNGGTIRYKGEDVADAMPNEYASQALKALENFNYQSLFAKIDGPLDGDVQLGLLFTGSNPEVLYDVPFQFDVTVEGELFNIARSLNPNGLQERVIRSVTSERAEE